MIGDADMAIIRRGEKYINDMLVDSSQSHIVSAFYNNALIWDNGPASQPSGTPVEWIGLPNMEDFYGVPALSVI